MSKKIKVACVEWHVIFKVGENSNCKSSSGHDVSVSLLPYTKSTSLVCLSLLHSYSESEFGQEKNATVGLTLWLSLYLEQSRTDLANSSHLHCKQASECSQCFWACSNCCVKTCCLLFLVTPAHSLLHYTAAKNMCIALKWCNYRDALFNCRALLTVNAAVMKSLSQ